MPDTLDRYDSVVDLVLRGGAVTRPEDMRERGNFPDSGLLELIECEKETRRARVARILDCVLTGPSERVVSQGMQALANMGTVDRIIATRELIRRAARCAKETTK